MECVDFDCVRQQALTLLGELKSGVCVRPTDEFNIIDESVFFAENADKAFNLRIMMDVDWDSPLSFYEEEADEFHLKATLMVDVANKIEGHEQELIELYEEWFS